MINKLNSSQRAVAIKQFCLIQIMLEMKVRNLFFQNRVKFHRDNWYQKYLKILVIFLMVIAQIKKLIRQNVLYNIPKKEMMKIKVSNTNRLKGIFLEAKLLIKIEEKL